MTGIKVQLMQLGEPDEGGRRSSVPTGETEELAVDCVVAAIGQRVDLGDMLKGTAVRFTKKGTVEVDKITLQTDESDIFAGGDIVTGPRFAIDAIAAGKEASISIHRFVHEGQSLVIGSCGQGVPLHRQGRSPRGGARPEPHGRARRLPRQPRRGRQDLP